MSPIYVGRVAILDLTRIHRVPDNSFGRLTYTLIFLLGANGYQVYMRLNWSALSSLLRHKYARLALTLEPRFFVTLNYVIGHEVLYLYDRTLRRDLGGGKCLRLDYDESACFGEASERLAMPFLMHPRMYGTGAFQELERRRVGPRRIRLFFAGNVRNLYDKPAMGAVYGKMTRAAILADLAESLPNGDLSRIGRHAELDDVLASGYASQFVWFRAKIPPERWLPTLARCDFFLGCPGVEKPMSHNVVEAMAVGCIPVLEYPEYFHPRLEHMKNCVVFNGQADLLNQVKNVLNMGGDRIRQLRQEAISYFEAVLTPAAFGRKLARAGKRAVLDVLAQKRPEG